MPKAMSLDAKLLQHLETLLTAPDDGPRGPRLIDDARRLWRRVRRFLAMNLVAPEVDTEALELACYALQMPVRQGRALPVGKMGQVNLRDRAEQAAELLIGALIDQADESLIDRASRLLRELPHRSPMLEEARVLADAVNLEDFGAVGIVQQTILLSRHGGGVVQLADGLQKRRQYGYWEARLKDGFHFEPVRQIARKRLEHIYAICDLLQKEIDEDQAP